MYEALKVLFLNDERYRPERGRLGKNLRYYFSSLLCRPFVTPDNATLHLTYQCNLQCPICEIVRIPQRDVYSGSRYNLTTGELESAIHQISALGVSEIMLTGGEPFLRNDLFRIIECCRQCSLEVDITTNGTLIDASCAEKIASSGIRHLQISVDGMNAVTHDRIRGRQGSLAKTINGIRQIQDAKQKVQKTVETRPTVGINTVVVNQNIDELVAMVSFFKALPVIQIVYLPFVADTSNLQSSDPGSQYWPQEEKLIALDGAIEKLVELKSTMKFFINPHQPCEYLLLLKEYYRRQIRPGKFRCLSALNRIVLGPNGDVAYCGGNMGNVREGSLKDIWYSPVARSARKEVKKCKNPCLQVCMGKTECENLGTIWRNFKERAETFRSEP